MARNVRRKPLPPEICERVIVMLAEWEKGYATLQPFHRPGLTAIGVAQRLDLFTGRTLRSGRRQTDWRAAERILKTMLTAGQIESSGYHRTLQAGSGYQRCWVPLGFAERQRASAPAANPSEASTCRRSDPHAH